MVSERAHLERWIAELRTPREAFNGMPACPYATHARVCLAQCESLEEAIALAECAYLPPYTVLVIRVPLEEDWSDVRLHGLNEQLASKDHIALLSDSREPIEVQGYRTTQRQGRYVILQRLNELKTARVTLAARGYYAHWLEPILRRIGIDPKETRHGRTPSAS